MRMSYKRDFSGELNGINTLTKVEQVEQMRTVEDDLYKLESMKNE